MFICHDVINEQGCFIFLQSRYDPVLEAVVTYTDDLAYNQAKKADELLQAGTYLGQK